MSIKWIEGINGQIDKSTDESASSAESAPFFGQKLQDSQQNEKF